VLSPLAIALAVAGAVFGVAADRLAVRWPEHDEEHPPGRPVGWRTVATAAMGAFAFGLLVERFGGASANVQIVFGAWFATLVLGFAVDLDQRLLPDELTLPVIPVALVPTLAVAIVVPLAMWVMSVPFGAGAFGIGDVKLLAGVGLMLGFVRTLSGLVSGLLAAGLVLAVLLAVRRIGRRTYVPFGPFLIFGALWGIVAGG
jgi:leader peptidase (prepilin peptidase)/N-methyltransferase